MAPSSEPPRAMPSHSPTKPMSFARLMALETLDADTYRSIAPAWAPGDGNRAFGGHVYAQAAYAAGKTVPKGMMLHNVTGHFILAGRVDIPFVYHVSRTHTGGSYAWRQVSAFQNGSATPSFIGTMSFKRAERDDDRRNVPIAHQSEPPSYLRDKYRSVLTRQGKDDPDTHPPAPSADTLLWLGRPRPEGSTEGAWLPGVDIRKVDMKAYNGVVGEGGDGRVGEWRQLSFYRILVDDDDDEYQPKDEDDELRLHISAHLFASDRNSLFMIQWAYGYQSRETRMGSLGHTVVFHGGAERLRMLEADNDHGSGGGGGDDDSPGDDPSARTAGRRSRRRRKWFVQEAWTSNAGENRACHESRLWDWDAGKVLATTLQDGMVRVSAKKGEAETDGAGAGRSVDKSRDGVGGLVKGKL